MTDVASAPSTAPLNAIESLFDPRSVAIVGASNDPGKWGYFLGTNALTGAHRRAVHLVNRSGGPVLGQQSYRSLSDLPETPELVAIAVPASSFEATIDEALALGTRSFVAITAGFAELGPEGREREQAIVERVRAAGARLLGPNCLGVFDAAAELNVSWSGLPSGPIGFVSQSGNLALELGELARARRLGFSRFASLGNQADLDVVDLVRSLTEHETTRLLALYVEDFRDGRAFAAACADAVSAGKPVLLLTVGGSEAAARAAASHTGALVSDTVAIDAACRAAGIDRVRTPGELVDRAHALLSGPPPRGPRLAIVADGGGHGALAADLATAAGLVVPSLSVELRERLSDGLPEHAGLGNPVDLAGGGEQDLRNYARSTRRLLESGEVDSVLLTGYFGAYDVPLEAEVAATIATSQPATGRPIFVHSMAPSSAAGVALRDGGVATYLRIEAAIDSLGFATNRVAAPAPRVPELPAPEAAVDHDGYWAARQAIATAGVPMVEARLCHSVDEVVKAGAELGFPVVLKALGILHKSDAGGVRIGLPSADELRAAADEMESALRPPAFSVEQMAPLADGVELIVGARRDARFGPIAMLGLGGIYTELLGDVAVGLAPLDLELAVQLLRSLRGSRLLDGLRGKPAVDLEAAARAAVAISELAAARPDIAEIEVNPLLVTPSGALGLDARIIHA